MWSGHVRGGPVSEEGFSGRQAADIVGITYRQLDYWARTDLVRPSLADARGSGSRRRYSYRDLLELKVVKTLVDAGIQLASVRRIFRYLRDQLGEDVTSANLVINGPQTLLVSGEDLVDVVRQGQGVLNVLPLATVKSQVDAAILPLRAPVAGPPAAGDEEPGMGAGGVAGVR
ncbi:MAG: MerR family transcriptional regulator [Acidimicrobiales bacterium]|nr:MerR family transcriptional regulator [Acidimicrobiales bacterium]